MHSGVTAIESYVFDGCSSMTEFTLPQTMTEIPEALFRGTAISNMVVPEGVTSIGKSAFNGCKSLSTINLPATLGIVGRYAFDGCQALTIVYAPEGSWAETWGQGMGCRVINQ